MKEFDLLVIMTVFNKKEKLKTAIESCLNQSYKNFHLVIIDDKSTDNSISVIDEYLNNEKITFLKNDLNKGCYYSRNKVLKNFSEFNWKYFTFHDADDTSSSERFSLVINQFENNEDYKIVMTPYVRVTDNTGKISDGDGIAFFRREIFNNIGFFDDSRFGADSEYIKRATFYMKQFGGKIFKLNTITYFAFVNESNLTIKYDKLDRIKYMNQKVSEWAKMKKSNNFYRNFN